jgi:hypothetical protein
MSIALMSMIVILMGQPVAGSVLASVDLVALAAALLELAKR